MEHRIHYDQRYETLLTVLQMGSYSAASEVLALTPSAVSQQIHSVEAELGVKLFSRSGNRLTATKECELVADYVRQVQSLFARLSDDIRLCKARTRRIAVGVTPSVEDGALSRMLTHHKEKNETAQVTVETASCEQLCALLRNGTLDIAILDGDFPRNEFHSILLDTDRLVVVVPPDSPYLSRGFILLSELQKEKLILRLPESGTRKLFEAHLMKKEMSISDFSVMMESENVDTIKKLVAGGYGVSVLSAIACRQDEKAGRIATIRLKDVDMSRSIHIVYRPGSSLDGLLKKLQDFYHQNTV